MSLHTIDSYSLVSSMAQKIYNLARMMVTSPTTKDGGSALRIEFNPPHFRPTSLTLSAHHHLTENTAKRYPVPTWLRKPWISLISPRLTENTSVVTSLPLQAKMVTFNDVGLTQIAAAA